MIKLLQSSLGMKWKDPSWLVSRASVEVTAHGSFCGQNSPLMTVGVGCTCGNTSPAPARPGLPWDCTGPRSHPRPAPCALGEAAHRHTSQSRLLDLLNLTLENPHRLGRKMQYKYSQTVMGRGASLWQSGYGLRLLHLGATVSTRAW